MHTAVSFNAAAAKVRHTGQLAITPTARHWTVRYIAFANLMPVPRERN
ncbi:MAG: hypothetical protein HYR72_04230 [Deltaproteobacteria bacterium]|nr:hypothetical protein [Deltaproteobacteria bacterium]